MRYLREAHEVFRIEFSIRRSSEITNAIQEQMSMMMFSHISRFHISETFQPPVTSFHNPEEYRYPGGPHIPERIIPGPPIQDNRTVEVNTPAPATEEPQERSSAPDPPASILGGVGEENTTLQSTPARDPLQVNNQFTPRSAASTTTPTLPVEADTEDDGGSKDEKDGGSREENAVEVRKYSFFFS